MGFRPNETFDPEKAFGLLHDGILPLLSKAIADSCTVEDVVVLIRQELREFCIEEPKPQKPKLPGMIIGICGASGSGKDTLARALRDSIVEYGISCTITAFAEPLKDIVHYTFLSNYLSSKELWGNKHTKDVQELLEGEWKQDIGRPLYQGFGEFMRRWAGYSYWVNLFHQNYKDVPKTGGVVIVTDVRYPQEEGKYILGQGGILIGVASSTRTGEQLQFPDHASEKGLQKLLDMCQFVLPEDVEPSILPLWCRHTLEFIARARSNA